ncbi:MAG: PASTA domain-containing protein [Gemmatimonadales bacterium]
MKAQVSAELSCPPTCFGAVPKGAVVEFSLPQAHSRPSSIAPAPDGDLWFTEIATGRIGRITPAGSITEFSVPALAGLCEPTTGLPCTIAAGPDGNMWFTGGRQIGRITPAGEVTSHGLASGPNSGAYAITAGSDGNVWFTQPGESEIGRITPAGEITEFALPAPPFVPFVVTPPPDEPEDLTLGKDGALWFTAVSGQGHSVGRITMTGALNFFSNTPKPLAAIVAGPDGNTWFSNAGGRGAGRLTPSGAVRQFPTAIVIRALTAGPDKNVWGYAGGEITRIAPDGSTTGFTTETSKTSPAGDPENEGPYAIAAGHDGNLWYANTAGNRIARVHVAALPGASPSRCVVPRLIGKTLNAARKSLARAHCRLGAVRHTGTAKGNHVASQRPAPGARLRPHGAVEVRVR